jgi:hypothetical protein
MLKLATRADETKRLTKEAIAQFRPQLIALKTEADRRRAPVMIDDHVATEYFNHRHYDRVKRARAAAIDAENVKAIDEAARPQAAARGKR